MFGPFVPSVGSTSPSGNFVGNGVIDDLREALEADGEEIAAFMIEPIQGSAGHVVPIAVLGETNIRRNRCASQGILEGGC